MRLKASFSIYRFVCRSNFDYIYNIRKQTFLQLLEYTPNVNSQLTFPSSFHEPFTKTKNPQQKEPIGHCCGLILLSDSALAMAIRGDSLFYAAIAE